jgi:hypothetical protein
MKPIALLFSFVALASLIATPARATFHIMQIEQVIAGVDGNTNAQAIQLRMRAVGQNLVNNSRLIVRDAAGLNPIVLITPPTSVVNQGVGVHILIASSSFITSTNPATTPDFIMTNLIPASYRAAGSLTFEDLFGTVYWRLSWGGASYTGPTTGALTNDADGNFGPPFAGPLPSSGGRALRFQGTASAPSTSNSTDYALTPGDAVFTNNAGTSFTVKSALTGVPDLTLGDELLQNTPNPFNPDTEIDFTLARSEHARLSVYDVRGALVATLVDDEVPPGLNRVHWDGRDGNGDRVATGVYYYRLTAGRVSQSKNMVLLK